MCCESLCLGSANQEYTCIWCKCPREERWDTSKTWSFQDPASGARSLAEISQFYPQNLAFLPIQIGSEKLNYWTLKKYSSLLNFLSNKKKAQYFKI